LLKHKDAATAGLPEICEEVLAEGGAASGSAKMPQRDRSQMDSGLAGSFGLFWRQG
jgi:hypothetical protein